MHGGNGSIICKIASYANGCKTTRDIIEVIVKEDIIDESFGKGTVILSSFISQYAIDSDLFVDPSVGIMLDSLENK